VVLTDEHKGFLFFLLKTVIDVLDQSGLGEHFKRKKWIARLKASGNF
jgi:hypothetical protein